MTQKQVKLLSFMLVMCLFVMGIVLAMDDPTNLFAQGPDGTPEATDEPHDDGTEHVTVPDPNSEDIVERGRYIVTVAAACQDCHGAVDDPAMFTAPLAVPLTGGVGFEFEPWGKVYTPNLTDLGEWSDEALENAIRYGVAPDGSTLLPPMPYEAYAMMSDADMEATIAYLRSLEPLASEIPPAEIYEGERADIRTVPDFDPEAEILAPTGEDELLARGTYLATSVAACIRCHGGLTDEGLLDPLAPPAGEVVLYSNFGEFNAPSLLAEDLGEWSDEAIRRVIVEGVKPDGDPIFLMPSHIFANLTTEDVDALLVWLRSQP